MFEVTILDRGFADTEVGTFDIVRPFVGQAIDEIGAIVAEVIELDDAARTAIVSVEWAD